MSVELDTVNRLLLEGARRHAREAVFSRRGPGVTEERLPDWRADRHAIRVALALAEGLGVGAGDVVALWMPLGLEWPIVERGVWALGAVSLALGASRSADEVRDVLSKRPASVVFCGTASAARALGLPSETRALVALEGEGEGALLGFDELLEQGGILDTPERATRCRAGARAVAPGATASIEVERGPDGLAFETRTQGDWARALARFHERYPPGRPKCLVSAAPDEASRSILYAGWADGLTCTTLGIEAGGGALLFGRTSAGTTAGSFVNLSELEWRAE